MKKGLFALAFGQAMFSTAAMAASVTAHTAKMVKLHGKMVMVHQMKMSDGAKPYSMSRRDFERLLDTRIEEQFRGN